MAKGKTNQPLLIGVPKKWMAHPAIVQLRDAGHTIVDAGDTPWDLILHPAAHWWGEEMFVEETRTNGEKYTPYLDAAITAGRKRKREAK